MKNLLGLMVIIFGSVTLVGCEMPDYVENQAMQEKANITQSEAEAIALEAVPGTLVSTTLDDEDLNRVVYQVTIDTDTVRKEVTVNAETGDIMSVEVDDDYVPKQEAPAEVPTEETPAEGVPTQLPAETNSSEQASSGTLITKEEAEAAALNEVPGTVIRTELDDENNAPIYEVSIKTSTHVQDVTVDAISGQVLYTEIDDTY